MVKICQLLLLLAACRLLLIACVVALICGRLFVIFEVQRVRKAVQAASADTPAISVGALQEQGPDLEVVQV